MSERPASATTAPRPDKRHGEAAAFWTRRAGRPVTPEQARVISENLRGFVSVLREWSVKADEPTSSMAGKTDRAGGQA